MQTSMVSRVVERAVGGVRHAGLLALAVALAPAPLVAQGLHGTPGKDGPGGVLTGVVNTYFPGTTATLAPGATTIALGAASGAAVGITPGDLLLVIQIQDADINSANTSSYGAGTGSGAGYTALNSAGRYEYVTAVSAVGTGGGTVTIRGAGPGNGLVNAYRNAAYGAAGQRRYQVIRVPQYSSATLSSGLTGARWDGTRGGILAIDVAGQLTLGGTVSVNGIGFRAGAGRGLTGGAGGTNTDYRTLAALAFHGMKGEGVAGTPRYVIDQATGLQVDNGVEGYPNGSSAQGAPGNAGGGGTDGQPTVNDENSGGGGGGNAGVGGRGGNTWNSNLPGGGRGGAVVPGSAALLVLGGGGGAGARNNSSGTASSGGAGGGMVFVRAGTIGGTGTITANGQNGNTPANDGGGGGGAGGTVVVYAASGPLTGLSVQARGGSGGNADVGGTAHGPGGGGGGGLIVLSSAATTDVSGGPPGYTVTVGNLYGATAGAPGVVITTLAAAGMTGVPPGSLTVPSLTVTKTTSTPTVVNGPSGVTVRYTITVSNAASRDTARTVSLLDTLPAGFTFGSTQAPVLAGGASRSPTTDPTAGAPIPTWSMFAIPGGGSVNVTFEATVAAGVSGAFQNPATAAYLDAARTTVSGQTSAGYAPGSSTGEDVTVQPDPSGPTTGTVTGTVFGDANGNGAQDVGETGIAGVRVYVTVGAVVVSVTTNASGGWTAPGVPVGTATVDVDDTTLPPGLVRTAGNDPTTVTVTAGATVSAGAVGYQAAASVQADLIIVKTDGRTTVNQLDTLSYTITVTNAGPGNVTGAPVTDNFPAGFTGVTWTCAGSGGGSCSAVTGSGNIGGVLVTVPVGGSAVFTVRGTATQTGALINAASIAAPSGVTDPTAGNNNSADTTTVVAQPLRFSSAANQTFTVGGPATAISPFTITNATNGSVITALRDLRVAIPGTLAMRWDTLDLSAVIGGTAAAKLSATVRYEDAGRTLVLDVLNDFAAAEQVTISGLSFTAFTAPSLAARLTLEVNNDNVVSATDDKTKTVVSNQAGCTTDPVTTVAQLRSAVANAACNPVNVSPGTYNLASDGQGTLTIARGTTIRNTGGGRVVLNGGGTSRTVYLKDVAGTVTLQGLTIQGGRISDNGGGLYCETSTLVINQSTIAGNTTTDGGKKGAGLYVKDCPTTLRNVTVSGNSHLGVSDGAGIYIEGGTLTAINSTVANNVAHSSMVGGGIFLDGSQLVLTNSLVADNVAGTDPQVHRKSGTLTSNGRNLVEGGCSGCLPSDLTGDPRLGPLADNGGDSWTQALLAGSPAINTALTSSAPPVDQRNVVRPQGPAADIGAFEAAVPAITVTPDGGQLSRRLPSNGVSYTASFVVSNTGLASGGFGLKAFRRPGAAVTIISVNGVAGDSVSATIAAGSALVVPVVYSVGNVASGVADSVYLRARSSADAAVSDTGFADLAVVRPGLTSSKAVVASGPPVPGTELTYLLSFTNGGTTGAEGIVLVDSLPAQLDFKVGSVEATLPSGVSAVVTYSSDLGVTWSYNPVSAACGAPAGYDRCVNRIRWTFVGVLSATSPANVVSLQFVARIR